MTMRPFRLYVVPILLLLTLFCGCRALFLPVYLIRGNDVAPEFDILKGDKKGAKRVAIASRSMVANQIEGQAAARGIARNLSQILADHPKHKKLKVVESQRIDDWLDNANNDFENFLTIGRDKSINADIIIGLELEGFQIRDPGSHQLIQGKCRIRVKAWDCHTGELLADKPVEVIDPPNVPLAGGVSREAAFKPHFIKVVAEQISFLFCPHDRQKAKRMDADSLNLYRID